MSAIISEYNARITAILSKNDYEADKKTTIDEDEVLQPMLLRDRDHRVPSPVDLSTSDSVEFDILGNMISPRRPNFIEPILEGSSPHSSNGTLTNHVAALEFENEAEASLSPATVRMPSPRAALRRLDFPSSRVENEADGDSVYQVRINISPLIYIISTCNVNESVIPSTYIPYLSFPQAGSRFRLMRSPKVLIFYINSFLLFDCYYKCMLIDIGNYDLADNALKEEEVLASSFKVDEPSEEILKAEAASQRSAVASREALFIDSSKFSGVVPSNDLEDPKHSDDDMIV
jgi:hypothetical protein